MRRHERRGQGPTLRPPELPTGATSPCVVADGSRASRPSHSSITARVSEGSSAAATSDASRRSTIAALAGCLAACLVTALWLSPALGRGVLLYRDFVQVPRPVLSPAALGIDGRAPRAVPLDAVTAVLHPLVSSGVQQQLLLLGSLALAGCGTAMLLRRHGLAAAVTGAVLATWNPYTAERLLLGQPPTLLGWAMIPWLVLAVRLPGSTRRRLLATALAAAPAALTPFGGLLAALIVLLTWAFAPPPAQRPATSTVGATTPSTTTSSTGPAAPAAPSRRTDLGRGREGIAFAALAIAWCLPWIVVGVLGTHDAGQRSGAAAFAVRHDGPLAVLDVLGGGGVWAPAAGLASRTEGAAVLPSLVLLAVAVLVALRLAPPMRRADPTTRSDHPDRPGPNERQGQNERPEHHPREVVVLARRHRRLLLAAVLLPPLGVLALATPVGLDAWAWAQNVPGVGLLRDTHRLLGPSALAVALLVGAGVGALTRSIRAPRSRVALTGAALTVIACSLAVLGAPEAPARTRAAYRPVTFPAGWQQAVDALGDRTTLVLPWQPFRRQGWAGPQPFLDPLPLALHGRAITATTLTVQRGGQTYVVGEDDDALLHAWARGDLAALRRAGIEAVVAWDDTPGTSPAPAAAGSPEIHDPLRVWFLRR